MKLHDDRRAALPPYLGDGLASEQLGGRAWERARRVIIDDGVFRPDDPLSSQWDEQVMVYCADPQAAAGALVNATPRLMRVLRSGRELSAEGPEGLNQEFGEFGRNGVNPPNFEEDFVTACEYVSEPEISADGAQVYMDTMTETTLEIAKTFFAVVGELLNAGVVDARIGRPPDDEWLLGGPSAARRPPPDRRALSLPGCGQ